MNATIFMAAFLGCLMAMIFVVVGVYLGRQWRKLRPKLEPIFGPIDRAGESLMRDLGVDPAQFDHVCSSGCLHASIPSAPPPKVTEPSIMMRMKTPTGTMVEFPVPISRCAALDELRDDLVVAAFANDALALARLFAQLCDALPPEHRHHFASATT